MIQFIQVLKKTKIVACYLANRLFTDGVYLWYIVVDKDHRNQNLGTYILKQMEEIHKTEGRKWIYFISPVVNLDFYSNRGYTTNQSIDKEFYKEF